MKKSVLVMSAMMFCSQFVFAQTTSGQMTNIKRNVATVMFAGLGGAILGLSTLSFYGEPQDHVDNIWIGLGAGVLAGTAYVSVRGGGDEYSKIEIPTNPHQVRKLGPQFLVYNFEF